VIHQVPAQLVPDLWSAFEHHVDAACTHHPFIDAEDIEDILLAGNGQLFIHVDGSKVTGFAVMEVIQYPRRKVASVLAAGGDKGFLSAAIHELLPELKKWGAQQGADTFAISGRPGWLRALRNHEFQSVTHVTLWATLDDLDIRRRREQESDSDDRLRTVEGGPALSH
jgi:hypothetical protein